ncbi:MAG: ABC transporter ATP-binding protein [Candidatus Hydrogenedentes bacterium]|nr:ABC transporter ATP-binding protein [Candidatus Hydrogenedentota bacterium]
MLELRNVVKQYDGGENPLRVLSNLNLRVEAGESIAIVGPSGCGKSTLLNLIGSLDSPTSGEVVFKDKNIASLPEADLATFRSAEIGFVFQSHMLLPQCTVLENILLPTLVGKDASTALDRATRLLERVGLRDRASDLPERLSGGERQRVAVVRALINKPSLLLADEPTGSLNQKGAHDLAQLLLELNREEQLTLIVVTHSMAIAELMGRVLELCEGALREP